MTNRYENLSALYQAARPDEEPTRADLRAVRTAMMSAGIAAVTFHTSTAAGKLLAVVPGSAKLFTLGQVVTYAAIGVAIGSGIATVGVVVQKHTATPATHSVQQATANRHVQAAHNLESAQVEPASPANSPSVAVAEAQSTAGVARSLREVHAPPAASVQQAEVTPPEAVPSSDRTDPPHVTSLIDESRGLAEVQMALSTGSASRALELLDQQDQMFASGSLTQERAAARVIALCTANRPEAAIAKERFIATYPGSPLMRRLNAACKNR